ncbi:MAG: T9SS type A sorting domain-containing protein [Bacteroidales bacterium]|nr:T9SS type A sorting domain-containing protein [Bacteroidales bacterium]
MRKKLFFFIAFLFGTSLIFAQNGQIILNSNKSGIKIAENSYEKLNLTFSHTVINSFSVQTKSGLFDEISIPDARFVGEIGQPKLPAYSKLIEIPFDADVTVNVLSYDVEEFLLSDYGIYNPIIPAQPDVNKSQDPSTVEFHYDEKAYKTKGVFKYELATIKELGIMRGVRIANLAIAPVEYDFKKGTIKVYNNIEVEVVYENANVKKTEYVKKSTYSPYFEGVYSKLINHKNVIDDHPDLTKYPVKMLILSDRAFEDALQPYILWKTQKGFDVIVNYTDEGYATVDQIKDWIQGYYDAGTPESPAPSFCLFVGDVAQIPASQTGVNSGKKTDLYYFSQDGDYFPEIYYGRFSANDLSELQPQIDKTLYYEKYEFTDPTYLDDVTLIAGADATWNPNVGQPTILYGTQNYFNTAHGFSTVNYYLDSYTGCYDNERISVSFINYTAHCAETVWGTPALSISDINNMTNTGKYPLAVGNCCLSADFNTTECIGEAWVRAEDKGAVAYIGSSPSTYWFEDFYWSVGAFPLSGDNGGYVPTVAETTMGVYDAMFIGDYVTVDATIFLGNLAVTEVDVEGYPQHSNPLYYWEAYNCLGDPSLMIYKTQGELNAVSHLPTLPIGLDYFEITAEPGSYVGISKDGVLYGAGLIDGTGTTNIPLTPITSGGDVTIVVTKSQYQPYIVNIPAASLNGPYLVVNDYVNNIDYGQTTDLDIVLENVGSDLSQAVLVSATTTDVNASLLNSTDISYGDIAADEITSPSSGAFSLTVADDIENGYLVAIDITIRDSEDSVWTYTKNVTVNAPEISIGDLFITNDDNVSGILDPGETGDINFTITNTGDATAVFNAYLSESSDPNNYLTLGSTTVSGISLAPGASQDFVFIGATADVNTPLGSAVELQLDVTAGDDEQYSAVDNQDLIIGIIPIYPISDEGTLSVCTGTFYDSGLDVGEYGINENYTMTFLPGGGADFVVVDFTSFETESGYDKLYVYDGPTTGSPSLGVFDGTNSPGLLMGANGLTFNFTSDGSVTKSGWEAEVSCYTATEPPVCPTNPIPVNSATDVFPTELTWAASIGAISYDVYFGTDSDPYTNTPTTVTSTQFDVSLDANTTYYWAVLPTNSIGTATGCDVWSFTTGDPVYIMSDATITTCSGVFYDTGGESGAYQSNENYTMTFLPETAGNMINIEFVSFATEGGYDYFSVYNSDDASNLIGTYDEDDMPPTNITASNTSGALTFVFTSDGTVTRDGWEANITCVTTYDITFSVTDGTNPLEGATVVFAGQTQNTDASGLVTIPCVEDLDVAYTVSMDGYSDATGTVDVDADKTVDITLLLTPTYDITFYVSDGTTQIEGATVSFNGATQNTDASGITIFNDVEEATGVSYSVTKTGYQNETGTVDVDADKTENVVMQIVENLNDLQNEVVISPNPTSGIFKINFSNISANAEVEIFTVDGKKVLTSSITADKNEFDLSDYESGLYMIKITTKDRVYLQKLIIE